MPSIPAPSAAPEQEAAQAAPQAAPAAVRPEVALPPPSTLKGRTETEERPVGEVLAQLSREKPVSAQEATSALEWFLSEDPDDSTGLTSTIELNVGVEEERWITWTVRPVDADELRRINRQTAQIRRRSGQDDMAADMLANLRVVLSGTVDPDITALAEQSGKDPIAMLRHQFRHKPGLISQLATKIMGLSGFDDEDVRDAIAAKNS